jgi:hypothetical protein
VRGREDICYLLAEVRALCGGMSTGLSTALTEDDETCVEPIGCGLGQEIFQSLPIFFSGPLHINFDSVTGAQRCSKSCDRSVRCAIESSGEGDRKVGRGDRGDSPALQAERNRDGEHGDASLRSLRFKPMTSVDQRVGLVIFLKKRGEGGVRTLPIHSHCWLSPRWHSRDLQGKNRLSAPSTRRSNTAHWHRRCVLGGRWLDFEEAGSCRRCQCRAD